MPTRTALLAGATGLVGSHLLTRLLTDPRYDRVIVLARRPLDTEHPKLDVRIADFTALTSDDVPPRRRRVLHAGHDDEGRCHVVGCVTA